MPSVSLPTVLCSNADPDQLPQACSSLHPVDGRPLSLPAARPPPPPPFHPLLTSVPSALPPCIWGQQRELSRGRTRSCAMLHPSHWPSVVHVSAGKSPSLLTQPSKKRSPDGSGCAWLLECCAFSSRRPVQTSHGAFGDAALLKVSCSTLGGVWQVPPGSPRSSTQTELMGRDSVSPLVFLLVLVPPLSFPSCKSHPVETRLRGWL